MAHCLLALLLPRTSDREVTTERKRYPTDRFDDLAVVGDRVRCHQIKAQAAADRQLGLTDLTTANLRFPIDDAIQAFLDDPHPADEYRLVLTCGEPDASLAAFTHSAPTVPPVVPGLPTQRYHLQVDAIWPEGSDPVWATVGRFPRERVARFFERFIIETQCPASSADLDSPGPLETALIDFLRDKIGIGRPPNDNRDLLDTAARLINRAKAMRTIAALVDQTADDVVAALSLRIDYGSVKQHLVIDNARLLRREGELDAIAHRVGGSGHVALVGGPGFGKSWLLHLLGEKLSNEGWLVATHYCFVDILDQARARRATIDAIFGSLLAQLLDANPELATDRVPRFAAGPRELETILTEAHKLRPDQRIAIIVDGLDHASRAIGKGRGDAAQDIANELISMQLPPTATVIVGSQPGHHLSAFLGLADRHQLSPWTDQEVRSLTRTDVEAALRESGLDNDTDRIMDSIVDRSRGNPLYATYLRRTVVHLVHGDIPLTGDLDIAAYIAAAPPFDDDLTAYYQWLVGSLSQDTGALFIAQLLSLLDFPVSAVEIGEIFPAFAHLVQPVLTLLAPVLVDEPTPRGIRIYHESFQRFVRATFAADPTAERRVLAYAIDWLGGRGFLQDNRAFRSLLGMLRAAGRDADVVACIDVGFVANAAAHGHPGDAVASNLAIAAAAAADLQAWPALSRLIELARSANNLFEWRLETDDQLAEAYGRAIAALFGAPALGEQLLHEARCTYRPRPGLVLCRLCEEHGIAAPWQEYRAAHDDQLSRSNAVYDDSEKAIARARLTGALRLAGREQSVATVTRWLPTPQERQLTPRQICVVLGETHGGAAVLEVVAALNPGPGRAGARVAAAAFAETAEDARGLANAALEDGLPAHDVRRAIRFGANSSGLAALTMDLDELTQKVCADDVRLFDGIVTDWLAQIDIRGALGDEAALVRAEILIPGELWFHRWLRFALILQRNTPAEALVNELAALAMDIDPFGGRPRVVDLYFIRHEIRDSFEDALDRLDDSHWARASDELARISTEGRFETDRYRSGPLPVDTFFELLLATADTDSKRRKASDLAAALLSPAARRSETYDTHAQDHLLLARIHAVAGRSDLAMQAWKEACLYLASYGQRRDITVFEVLDPIEALGQADGARGRELLRKVQPIVERVLVHTDGKDTRHCVHRWIDAVARLAPSDALMMLAKYVLQRDPSFGAYDHALATALTSLGGVPVSELVAGWVGSGLEARGHAKHAIESTERALNENVEFAGTAWSTIGATLIGDGKRAAAGVTRLLGESASRIHRAHPPVAIEDEEERESIATSSRSKSSATPEIALSIEAGAPPLRIAHIVRQWQWNPNRCSVDAVTNAVGWRLLDLLHTGREEDAAMLIRRIARDSYPWDSDGLLVGLAGGLERHGATELAAAAATYAYTRGYDGWRRFGGQDSEHLLLHAISLDSATAWRILAEEVSEEVAGGGGYGINAHLIELLVASGRIEVAFQAWDEAYRIVLSRVPAMSTADELGFEWEESPPDPRNALMCAISARMNHAVIVERRSAMTATALLAGCGGEALGYALDLAAERASPSVLVALLHIAKSHEPAPYDATLVAERSLRQIAAGELCSARVLARRLLHRAGIQIPLAPPLDLPNVPAMDEARVRELLSGFGRTRVDPIKSIWPDFGHILMEQLDVALQSNELRDRMIAASSGQGRARKGRRDRRWWPFDEEVHRVMQRTASAVRMSLASRGEINPDAEDTVGDLLLPDLNMGIRVTLSRTARPAYYLTPIDAPASFTEPNRRTVPDGDFHGWVILAHQEEQLIPGDRYDRPIEASVVARSSLGFVEGPVDLRGRVAVGVGDAAIWTQGYSGEITGPFEGPVGCYDISRDAFGPIEILVPDRIVVSIGGLTPGKLGLGLTLVDGQGEPAVVCRSWRQRLLGDEHLDEHEYFLSGLELLARPDLVAEISRQVYGSAVYVATSSRSKF